MKTHIRPLLFISFIMFVSLFVFQRFTRAAGGGPTLYLSSQTVGETMTIDARFNNACYPSGTPEYQTKTFDRLSINIDFFDQITESVIFENPTVTVRVNGQQMPGTIWANYGSVLHWVPDNGETEITSYDNYEVTVTDGKILQKDTVGFSFEFYHKGLPLMNYDQVNNCYYGWNYINGFNDGTTEWSYIRGLYLPGEPTATPIPRVSPSATPTATPTATPSTAPTPSPVPLEQLGFQYVEPVYVTVPQGGRQSAYILKSIDATSFVLYGYPTSYGPGINNNVTSGGIQPGGQFAVSISVNYTVPVGTYSGVQRVMRADSNDYSLIPVTVQVVGVVPTTTPTTAPTTTPTATATPSPTRTPTPTPVPELAISQVRVSHVTTNSATITWTTTVPSTSQVRYGTSSRTMRSTTVDSTYDISHQVVLNDLQKGKTYTYSVISVDQKGNIKTSGQYTFTTDRK